MTAHPRIDPETGEMVFFANFPGRGVAPQCATGARPAAPVPPPASERLDAFLDALVIGNQDVPVAISLVNTALMRVPATDRRRAIGVAIEELVRSRLSPSILNLLKAAPVEGGNGGRRDDGDNINWE